MKQREQAILLKAGFRIFRMEEIRMRINECSAPGAWRVYSTYLSKAAMKRGWAALMNDEKNLEG